MEYDNFSTFWALYRVKKGKKKAEIAFNRLSNKKQLQAIEDIKTRFKDVEGRFIPHPTTYINGERWNDEKAKDESQPAIKEKLKDCCVDGCKNECHGPDFPYCTTHLPAPPSKVLDKMREKYKQSGMIRQEGESAREHSLRLRKEYMSKIFNAIWDMDKYK